MKNDSINSKLQELVIKLINYSSDNNISCYDAAKHNIGIDILEKLYRLLSRYSISYLYKSIHISSSSSYLPDFEGIYHDAIIKMLNSLESFNPDMATFLTWYTKILHNTAISYINRDKIFSNCCPLEQPNNDEDRSPTKCETSSPYGNPETDLINAEISQEIFNAIRSLPPRLAQVVSLELIEGQKPKEIASKTGRPVEEIYNDLKIAKKRLREKLEDRIGR